MDLRILHIDTERNWGGGQNQISQLCAGLAAMGVEIHLATPRGSALGKKLSGMLPILELGGTGQLNLRTCWALKNYLNQNSINLIASHTARAHGLGFITQHFKPQIKHIVHRRVYFPLAGNLWTRWKYLSPRVSGYICVSKATAKRLNDFGIPEARTRVVLSSVANPLWESEKRDSASQIKRDAALQLRHQCGIESSAKIIACVGRLSKEKGLEFLLEAMMILCNKNRDIHLAVIGDGPLKVELVQKTIQLGLKENIHFLGFQNQVMNLVAGADVLAFPSLSEGLGTSAAEGLLVETPVVATEVGGLPEIIRHGETGFLVKPMNSELLAQGLFHALTHHDEASNLAHAGSVWVREKMSSSTMVEGTLRAYRELVR